MSEDTADTLPPLQPLDEYNQLLRDNVHPPAWTNPTPAGRYNMVVIGAGTAGLVTAAGAAGLGAKVALIERALLGGDCLNVGCVPSKAIIRSARACADARDAHKFGVRGADNPHVDFSAVMQRMRKLRSGISKHDSAKRFTELGVDVYIGGAKFTSSDTVEVAGQQLKFAKACIATGARAAQPPIPGIEEAGYLTNETVFSLTELPKRLAVIGAGPIGCEMAQAFARFGSKVTLLESMHQILGKEDRDAAKIVEQTLRDDGVEINCCCKITGVRAENDEKVISFECEASPGQFEPGEARFDAILIAVGRAPNIETLNLEAAGVQYDRTGVTVNDRLQTTNKNIYAAGDVAMAYKFTHAADAAARIVIQNALFFGRAKASSLTMPWVTYTDPEIAHVGMYESDAREKGIAVKTIDIPLAEVDRAILEGETQGFLRVHVKKGSGKILGATMVARHAGEMISEATLAMVVGKRLGTLSKTIHPYPTQAEAFRKAGDAFNRDKLTPFVKTLFTKFLALRR